MASTSTYPVLLIIENFPDPSDYYLLEVTQDEAEVLIKAHSQHLNGDELPGEVATAITSVLGAVAIKANKKHYPDADVLPGWNKKRWDKCKLDMSLRYTLPDATRMIVTGCYQ